MNRTLPKAPDGAKSRSTDLETLNQVGASYYVFCLETAITAVQQARHIVKGDEVEINHELPHIEALLTSALEAS